MNWPTTFFRISRLLPALLVFSAAAAIAEVKITATLEPTEIRPGGSAAYTLVIENGQPDEVGPLELPAGLSQIDPAPNYQFQSTTANGATTNFSILTWRLSASRPGTFVVPPQLVHVDGKPVKSSDARLVVKNNASAPVSQYDPLLTIETSKREIYAGEVIPINVNIYVHRRCDIRRIGLIEVPKDNFAIERFPTMPEQTIISMGGVPYRALTFASTLSGLKPGKFKLGPAACELILDIPVDSAGSQRNPFLVQAEQRTIKPKGNFIEMTVLPLPEKDRPPGFVGVVGDFSMNAIAEPVEVGIGEPISVEVDVAGSGNFDAVTMPPLSSPDGWKTYPARRFKPAAPRSNQEAVQTHTSFTQVIIPQKNFKEIPSFELHYFSPTQKKYLIARTDPIPLRFKVAPDNTRLRGAGESASGATGETKPSGETLEKTPPPQVKMTDIVTVLPNSTAWLSARPILWRDRNFLIWNAAALGALVMLIAGKAAVTLWRARAASPLAPARKVMSRLRGARMNRAEFYAAAAQLVQLRPDGPKDAWQPILKKYETLNFGSGQAEALEPIPARERKEALRILRA